MCFDLTMAITRTSVEREALRRMRRLELQLGEDIRRMRVDAGLTLTALGGVVGIHRSHLARIESGLARPSLEVLTAIGVGLGADLSLRYFEGAGPRLHDRFQAAMVEAMIKVLDRRWMPTLEVPVSQLSRGVIDLVLSDRSSPIVVAAEAQSEIRRLEQQLRWGTEKADGLRQRLADRDPRMEGVVVSKLLILRSTVSTRQLSRRFERTLATAFPAPTDDVFRALTTSAAPWPGAGIFWVRIDGDRANVLEHPLVAFRWVGRVQRGGRDPRSRNGRRRDEFVAQRGIG
jgi:transcriptional regulator with XRE-family HTH domain